MTTERMSKERLNHLAAGWDGTQGPVGELVAECRRAREREELLADQLAAALAAAQARIVELEKSREEWKHDATAYQIQATRVERDRAELVELATWLLALAEEDCSDADNPSFPSEEEYARAHELLARLSQPPQQATGKEGK